LTQKELALRTRGKVDYSYIGKIERGEQLPSLKMLIRLSDALAVPLSYFFQGIDTEGTPPRRGRLGGADTPEAQQVRLLRDVVQAVHADDVPLLIEIVRILNKHRKAQRTGRGEGQASQPPGDGLDSPHAAESPGPYRK
jgi:transcriptional regulator with XRE-family HTH domain